LLFGFIGSTANFPENNFNMHHQSNFASFIEGETIAAMDRARLLVLLLLPIGCLASR